MVVQKHTQNWNRCVLTALTGYFMWLNVFLVTIWSNTDYIGCLVCIPIPCTLATWLTMQLPDIKQGLTKLRLTTRPTANSDTKLVSMYYQHGPFGLLDDDLRPSSSRSLLPDLYSRGRYASCRDKNDLMQRFLKDIDGKLKLEKTSVCLSHCTFFVNSCQCLIHL